MSEALRAWVRENPVEAQDKYLEYRRMRARLAREDINEFIEFVIKDERTNKPVKQAPHHEEFHALADTHKRLILWAFAKRGRRSNLRSVACCGSSGAIPTCASR